MWLNWLRCFNEAHIVGYREKLKNCFTIISFEQRKRIKFSRSLADFSCKICSYSKHSSAEKLSSVA